jgi:hypothetical protein
VLLFFSMRVLDKRVTAFLKFVPTLFLSDHFLVVLLFHCSSFRDDSRKGGEKSRQVWEFRSNETEGGSTDQIRPWIGGFVAAMGEERAFLLLKDAGLPQNFKVFNKNEWRVKKSAVHSYLKNGLDPQLIDFLDQHAG